MNRIELKTKFLSVLNAYWSMIPYQYLPTYGTFNCVIPVYDNIESLRLLEKEFPKLGIANHEQTTEGLSTLAFIATITDLLIDERLCAKIEQNDNVYVFDRKIIGWSFYEKESIVIDKLTNSQKLKAIELKYDKKHPWIPKSGDKFAHIKNDNLLFEIISNENIDDKNGKYTIKDLSTETICYIPYADLSDDVYMNSQYVYVPDFIFTQS